MASDADMTDTGAAALASTADASAARPPRAARATSRRGAKGQSDSVTAVSEDADGVPTASAAAAGGRKRKQAPTATPDPNDTIAPPVEPAAAAAASPQSTSARKRRSAAPTANATPSPAPSPELSRRQSSRRLSAAAEADEADAAAEDGEDEEDDDSGDGEDEEDGEDDDEEGADDEEGEAEGDAEGAAPEDGSNEAPKRRGRPKGSKNRPRDPDDALQFDLEQEAAERQSAKRTGRQRAMAGEGAEEELLSLPMKPTRAGRNTTKGPPTEEQLAKKAAQLERRKQAERARMEREKADTIHRLLHNQPTKRGSAPTDGRKKRAGGRGKKAVATTAKDPDAAEGDDDAAMGPDDALPAADSDAAVPAVAPVSKPATRVRPTNRSRVVWRSVLQRLGGESEVHMVDHANGHASAASASDAAAASSTSSLPAAPLPATLCQSVSFPLTAPLPDTLFSFDVSVAYMRRARRAQSASEGMQPEAEASKTGAMGTEDVPPAPAPTPVVTRTPAAPRPTHCSRSGCRNARRYLDSDSRLPVCSIECIQKLRGIAAWKAAKANEDAACSAHRASAAS